MADLKSMLDFANFRTTQEIEHHFYEIAQHLFYKYELQTIAGDSLKITDLELYIYHHDGFKDEGMHKHHSQMTSGRFYIHRHHNNPSSFKKPSYIGVDITCGSPFSCYASILIRETRKGDEFFSCSKTVLELIGSQYSDIRKKKWEDNELDLLHRLDDSSIFGGPIHLKEVQINGNETPVWTSKREIKTSTNPFLKHHFKVVSSHSSKQLGNLTKSERIYKKSA